jgi:tRNA wybutosine-synthesizing protein 1
MPGDQGFPVAREEETPDDPGAILDNAVIAQRRILNGYNPVCHPKVDSKMYEEARNPRHVAISLVGEPTQYEKLSALIGECRRRNWTSYLVTNGTNPEVLRQIEEPTQLYLSFTAPDRATYSTLCRPALPKAWERLHKSLGMLPTFSCPTVVRLTLVAGCNMHSISSYASVLNAASPRFIECKAYMHVGGSMQRLSRHNMPQMKDVREFAKLLANQTGYFMKNEDCVSRVVLLSRSG